jgi:hypothetical protein
MTSAGRQQRARSVLSWLTLASLAILTAGFVVLLAYCIIEASANPDYSLADAYWRGRLPWIAIAEITIVAGATATVVSQALATLTAGPQWQRLLVPPAAVAVALWWFTAVAMSSMRAVPCPIGDRCPVPGPDPWAFAYSAPQTVALLLILPALFVGALALSAQRDANAFGSA